MVLRITIFTVVKQQCFLWLIYMSTSKTQTDLVLHKNAFVANVACCWKKIKRIYVRMQST